MHRIILGVGLGLLAAVNCVLLIFMTDTRLLIALNVLVATPIIGIYLFIEIKIAGLARELGLSRAQSRLLISNYFNYYKNVERISIYEYHERTTSA